MAGVLLPNGGYLYGDSAIVPIPVPTPTDPGNDGYILTAEDGEASWEPNAGATPSAWTNFTLINGWANAPLGSPTPGWRVEGNIIRLRGTIDSTAQSDPVFATVISSLIVPTAVQFLGSSSTDDGAAWAAAGVAVLPGSGQGTFQCYPGSGSFVVLDGITYPLT